MNKMKSILEGIYKSPELRQSIVPLFIGDPGLGKTVILKEFAKEKGAKVVEFITSQRNPYEISGMAMPDRDTKKMSIWDFDEMLTLKDGDILFFDEVLNGNPMVLNACLTLLESRVMISGKKLPDVMIVAAANTQGMVPLTPQIKERFMWYTVNYNSSLWKDHIKNKYSIPNTISSKLSTLISKEDFKGTSNFHTPRSVVKAIKLSINEVPSPYTEVSGILSTLTPNVLVVKVVLPDGTTIEPNETLPFIEILKLKNKHGNTTK